MPSTRVLVADDLPHLALYLQHMLKKAGYEATVVNRAEQVQAALDEFRPAALLMNVEMHGRSGLEICRGLKEERRNAGLVVIFITGDVFESAALDIFKAGANGFLLKPVSPGALVGKLNELGLAADSIHAARLDVGSGLIIPFAETEELSTLERFKIELTLGLAPLAEALRAGAFLTAEKQRGWLVRPDRCNWPEPDLLEFSEVAVKIKKEQVMVNGVLLCSVFLCADGAREQAEIALKACAALLKQIQRVVEFGRQREDLFDELGLDHECLNSIYEISTDGQLLRKPKQAFDKISRRTVRAMTVSGAVRLALWILDAESGLLEAVRCHRVEPQPVPRNPRFGLIGKCCQEAHSQLVNLALPLSKVLEPEFAGAKHIAVTPIKGHAGVIGALAVWHEGDWALDSRHLRLLDAMAAQTATVIENDNLLKKTIDTEIRERELDIGGKIQQSLLFSSPPTDSPDFEFGLYAEPSLQIGGDFFEFFRFGACCDIVVGDVMGKGVPAALVGAGVKGQFLRYAREQRGDASGEAKNIVASVHREVSRRLINLECFITVCYARFDSIKRKMTYVDCGHPRPLHFNAETGKASALEFDWPRLVNIPLGTHPQATYEQADVAIQPGDIFLFYSDGFTEAVGEDERLFGEQALLNLLVKHNHRHAPDIAEKIKQSLNTFVKTGGIRDDLTCIVVKVLDSDIRKDGSREMLVIDARPEQLSRLRAYVQVKCENLPFFKQEEQQLYNLQLAVTEAATNIVKYAYKDLKPGEVGQIRMELTADNFKVEIKLFDTGVPFDPSSVPEPVMEGLQESGRGVYLIKTMLDKVQYLRSDSGVNCLHMVKIIERRRKRSP